MVNCTGVAAVEVESQSPLSRVGVLPSNVMSQVRTREVVCHRLTIVKMTI